MMPSAEVEEEAYRCERCVHRARGECHLPNSGVMFVPVWDLSLQRCCPNVLLESLSRVESRVDTTLRLHCPCVTDTPQLADERHVRQSDS